jgi:hypothetical protein
VAAQVSKIVEGLPGVRDHRYLIIGGTTKAATTSLFYYLADHPQVCGASRKETRFFAEGDFTRESLVRLEDGLEKYGLYFSSCPESAIRVEATPDYLHCPAAVEKIYRSLPKAQLLFILREPVSRLFSWYRFSKQIGATPESTTFDEYVQLQLGGDGGLGPSLRTLEQGRYCLYLEPFFEAFGRDRVSVIFYEDVSRDPRAELKKICRYAGIEQDYYDDYDFQVFGRTKTMRNVGLHRKFISLRQLISAASVNRPGLYLRLRKLWHLIEPIYARLNVVKTEDEDISRDTLRSLREYYGPYNSELHDLLEKPIPWGS